MSRLKTLVRVAELQEAAARSQAARAIMASATARGALSESETLLRSGGLVGGSRADLTESARLQLVRAEAVSAAQVELSAAEQAQQQAVHGWTERRRRQRLLEGLHERHREAERLRQEKAEQQLVDELASARPRVRR